LGYVHLFKDVLLFWWHAWGTVVSQLVTFGLSTFGFAIFLPVFRYLEHRWKKVSHKDAIERSRSIYEDNIKTPFYVFIAFGLLVFSVLAPYKLHEQDELKIASMDSLREQVRSLQEQLEMRENNLDVHSPAANNLMYMLQAFRGYRGMIGGFKPTSCHIRVTAPSNAGPIPSAISGFSIQVTNCETYGPMPVGDSPDEERDTLTGMIPGVIVFHSRRGDKAAFALFDNLSNLLPLKRSFDVPKGSPDDFIWLQFGSDVHWNSERTRPHPAS
jgi:hypothetical protein